MRSQSSLGRSTVAHVWTRYSVRGAHSAVHSERRGKCTKTSVTEWWTCEAGEGINRIITTTFVAECIEKTAITHLLSRTEIYRPAIFSYKRDMLLEFWTGKRLAGTLNVGNISRLCRDVRDYGILCGHCK